MRPTRPQAELADDVVDALRALRAADVLRQRGTALRTSGGYEVFFDARTADVGVLDSSREWRGRVPDHLRRPPRRRRGEHQGCVRHAPGPPACRVPSRWVRQRRGRTPCGRQRCRGDPGHPGGRDPVVRRRDRARAASPAPPHRGRAHPARTTRRPTVVCRRSRLRGRGARPIARRPARGGRGHRECAPLWSERGSMRPARRRRRRARGRDHPAGLGAWRGDRPHRP